MSVFSLQKKRIKKVRYTSLDKELTPNEEDRYELYVKTILQLRLTSPEILTKSKVLTHHYKQDKQDAAQTEEASASKSKPQKPRNGCNIQ